VAGCAQGSGATNPLSFHSSMRARPDIFDYRSLYSFQGGGDGETPSGALLEVAGPTDITLYGTTVDGGRYNKGTVFASDISGDERTIYSFSGTAGDGRDPVGDLVAINGVLYGTTISGGGA